MDEDSNVQIKIKGQRKSKKKQDPEENNSVQEHVDEDQQHVDEEQQVEEEPKVKSSAKKSAPKKSTPKVEVEDYDVEQQPDVVIHKRHKGAKPRKIIVITGDSEADESDEDLPYRAKPKMEIKKRQAKPREVEPEPEPPKPAPKPKIPRKQNVGLVTEKPQVVDAGRGLPERYANVPKKQGFVVDEFIDKLLGL